jgi:hypothetical protein
MAGQKNTTQRIHLRSLVPERKCICYFYSLGDLCVVHLLSEGVPSREDTFLSWHLAPVSKVTRYHLADHALFKIVRYVLLRPLRPELDANTKTCLPVKTHPPDLVWLGKK